MKPVKLAETYRQGLLDWKRIATDRGRRLSKIERRVAKMKGSRFAAVKIWAEAIEGDLCPKESGR